jgi:large repetitive protein
LKQKRSQQETKVQLRAGMHRNPIRRESVVGGSIAWLLVSCQPEPGAPAQPDVATAGHAATVTTDANIATDVTTDARALSARHARTWQRDHARDVRDIREVSVLRGMPRDEAVREQLGALAPDLGLSQRALQGAQLERSHRLPTGGSVVQLAQRAHGLPIFRAHASVTLDAQQRVVAVSSELSNAAAESAAPAYALTPEAALARLYEARTGLPLTAAAVGGSARAGHYALHTAAHAPSALEALAKRVYFPVGEQLIPAYHAELLLRDWRGQNQAFGAVIDARAQGEATLLWSANLTASEAFTYRVWADPQGAFTPADGPLLDATPYPGAAPNRQRQAFAAPVLITMEGFNHNPAGVADPWLSANATETLGNNVTAYTDRDATSPVWGLPRRDGFTAGDVRATTTALRTFDYVYDLARAPEADDTQLKASVTQIFYVTNWLHDFWYDSGFDEAAGNAQADNYGRGGEDGDPLRAEAQDAAESGATNNANMSVLSDGGSPRMQMYVWNGLPVRTLVTEPPLSFEDELGAASYGPQTFDDSGELQLVDDGSEEVAPDATATAGSVTDGCQRMSGLSDRIAVVERGGCTFVVKLQNLQRAGAKAVLILDNAPGHTAVNPSTATPPDISMPVLALSYEDGQKVKALLQSPNEAPPRAARFYRGPETMRDGTLDNSVVAHEWGHYMHLRLVRCASLSCAGMSEGWGDFIALMMVLREGDALDNQVFPLSQYATGGLNQNSAYFGTRRAPYSTDLTKNPFTFKHVREDAELPTGSSLAPTAPEMNESHNVGEIWAALLFEAYVNVIKAGQAAGRTFAESQRRMADYVVAGMKAAPTDPTFVEQRDALIASVRAMAADDATRAADVDAFLQGFAKRGLGAGAVAPSSNSTTLNEAEESFEVAAP